MLWKQTLAHAAGKPPILISGSSYLYYSPDGGATLVPGVHDQGAANFTNIIRLDNGKYATATSTGKLLVTQDGINWTTRTIGSVGTDAIRSIAYANGAIVVVTASANSSLRILKSVNEGLSWTNGTYGTPTTNIVPGGLFNTNGVAACFVGGNNGELILQVRSDTMQTAHIASNFGTSYQILSAVAYLNSTWLVGGGGAKISTAGTTASGGPSSFVMRTGVASSDVIMDFAYDAELGLYVGAGGVAGGAAALIKTSTNATTWTQQTISGGPVNFFRYLLCTENYRLAGCNNGELYATSDWRTFTLVNDLGAGRVSGLIEMV